MTAVRTLFAVIVALCIVTYTVFTLHSLVFAAFKAAHRAAGELLEEPPATRYAIFIHTEGQEEERPALPDLSPYTVQNVESAIPKPSAGAVEIRDVRGLSGLREFTKMDGGIQRLRVAQQDANPVGIFIRHGHYDFPRLYAAVKASQFPDVIRKLDEKYLFRAPVLVGRGASLTLSGEHAEAYLLSAEQSAFIANSGELFILRATLTGWSEKDAAPARFQAMKAFRPFLVSWSGARMSIAGSRIESLGYQEGKSYGVTYSSCEPCLLETPGLPPATGVIVDSIFTDLYFGFYSFEAEGVAIVGNTYDGNVIYGIDPHDRSRRLVIAGNHVTRTRVKHGIITSRDVNDSWIFDNVSTGNNGSGIMLDRASQHNVVAGNLSSSNGGDGITFFESPNNLVYRNQVFGNRLSGVRIRNSWNLRFVGDQIAGNGRVPVEVYSADLSGSQQHRDLALDPYERKADASFTGTVLKPFRSRYAFKIDGIRSLSFSDVYVLSGAEVFPDYVMKDDSHISRNMTGDSTVALVTMPDKPR
jgi:poly(beta-D-mannuronate) C5 epimerase